MRKNKDIFPFYDKSNDSQVSMSNNYWISGNDDIQIGSKVGATHDAVINGKVTTIKINGTVSEIKPSKKDGTPIYKIVRDDGTHLWVKETDIITKRKNNLDEIVSRVIQNYIKNNQ